MRLTGLTLETIYFEDYLSFLIEVLELDLCELTDASMKLDLSGTWLEIKKVTDAPKHMATNVEFSLEPIEFISLVNRISFFYYRKGPSRFLFLGHDKEFLHLTDPDGRMWRFTQDNLELKKLNSHTFSHLT